MTTPISPASAKEMPTADGRHGRLEIRNIVKRFGSKTVLDDVSFDIEPGEVVSLIGPSGSGKSTLLSLLTGALTPDSGEILFDGRPVGAKTADEKGSASRPFAFMPQRDVLMPWRRIEDNAGIGLEVAGVPRKQARRRVAEMLEPFGLDGTEKLYPRQLSGGMRQRVSFLRTVIQNLPVLLLDEPFGALDAITRDELQRWLLNIWAENQWSILLITHDIREAIRMSDRVFVLPTQPGPLLGDVRVDRSIPRDDGFPTDPQVPLIEEELHRLLTEATGASGT